MVRLPTYYVQTIRECQVSMQNIATDGAVRVDKWLWAARFFKTRQMATEAVSGGHVQLNGERVKPGRKISVNDQLRVNKAGMTWHITVTGLVEKRVSAKLAQSLYVESAESLADRALQQEQRRLNVVAPAPKTKPDKRQRRQLSQIKFD